MITSTSNRRVKEIQRLHRRRERDERRRFLIEGEAELRRALAAGVELETVVTAPDAPRIEAPDAETLDVSESVMQSLAYRGGPVAVARMFETGLERIRLEARPLILVVAQIEKPGNLGAMLRSASAAGVSAVIAADPVTDLFNPNVVRASLGALFSVPTAVAPTAEALDWLRARRIRVLATTPEGARPLWDAPLAEPSAIVVGAEHAGLADEWLQAADECMMVPMPGGDVDSLNAAATAAVVLFEAVRQRR